MKKKSFFLLIILSITPQFFFCKNDLKGVCPQPIIHIYNNVSTGGSSIGSAFKCFSLMIVAWESGAHFTGYPNLGFINNVLKPVFNWLKKQTNFSASRFIDYLRAKNHPTVNFFIACVLEPMRQRFFPVEGILIVEPRDTQNVSTRMSDLPPVNDNRQEIASLSRVDQNEDQIPNQDTVSDKDADKKNLNNPEIIPSSFVAVSKPISSMQVPVNNVPAFHGNLKQKSVVIPQPVRGSDVLHNVNPTSNAGIEKMKRTRYSHVEEFFVEEFLNTQYQKGDKTKQELIDNFYSPDPKKFPKFSRLSDVCKKYLRVSFFLYIKSVCVNPVPRSSDKGGVHGRGFSPLSYEIPRIYDEAYDILESMAQLCRLFEESPHACIDQVGAVRVSHCSRL